MKWFRDNVKQGSRLALVALAIQFALSFGHFHGLAAQAASTVQTAQAPAPSGHEPDQQPADACAICAVVALAHTALFATPPSLPLPQAVELAPIGAKTDVAQPHATHPAFQSRAPPIS